MKDQVENNPLVSVVIPCYNHELFVQEAIQSIINQTYKDWEVIVVDNASTDNTSEVMAKYLERGQISYVVNDKNYERSYSRNRGIQMAKGDYISLLDSDDVLYPDCLQKAAAFIASNPGTAFFHCLYEILGEDYQVIKRPVFPPVSNPFKSIAKGNFISNIGVFYRKDLLEKVKFDEDSIIIGVEDYDFVLNMLLHTEKVGRINEYCCGIYNHAGRSVHHEEWERTKKRISYFIEKQEANPLFMQKMAPYRHSFLAHMDLSLASFCAARKKPGKAIKYIFSSLWKYPLIFTELTFWKHIFVTLKNVI